MAFRQPDGDMLADVRQRLAAAATLETVQEIVRRSARRLVAADGATLVLRDGDHCYYADEDAVSPRWKGERVPIGECIIGWAMLHRQAAVIADIRLDDRIPKAAYRPAFVHSLVVVPIRPDAPLGAIGAYWATPHWTSETDVDRLGELADAAGGILERLLTRRSDATIDGPP